MVVVVDSSTSSSVSSSENDSCKEEQSSLPIMVGYAFGPKKMSTMKQVMKDASNSISEKTIQFVSLDLNCPLHPQQHDVETSFDVILHKMTEDILLLSNLSSDKEKEAGQGMILTNHDNNETDIIKKAQWRIQQLVSYKESVPSCRLIDHPKDVKTLLCRSDTSHMLSQCLVNVTTKTYKIHVRTPNFQIVHHPNQCQELFNNNNNTNNNNNNNSTMLTFPLIAKPLVAAGTVQSHKMIIIRRRDGMDKITIPCLLQEYVNHNEQLFKVYVLGDHVWVFARQSLPDLPHGEGSTSDNMEYDDSFLEFDSQKTYPSLSDFHINTTTTTTTTSTDYDTKRSSSDNTSSGKEPIIRNNTNHKNKESNCPFVIPDELKPDEIRPIVEAIRNAFSIDLFGFDLLMTTELRQSTTTTTENNHRTKELLVVDVNYFPSYKEVNNFPFVLANYLLQKGMEGRNRANNNSIRTIQ